MVEHSAVNRRVVGSSPTREGMRPVRVSYRSVLSKSKYGSVVKRLRHRPFTAVTRVRFPSESLNIKYLLCMPMWLNWQSSMICNQQVIGSSPIIGSLDL